MTVKSTHNTADTYIIHIVLAQQQLWFRRLAKLEEKPYHEQGNRGFCPFIPSLLLSEGGQPKHRQSVALMELQQYKSCSTHD